MNFRIFTCIVISWAFIPQILACSNDTMTSNKIIPIEIKEEALKALSFYPGLRDTKITFKFKPTLTKSVMKAQPVFSSLFGSKQKRAYIIFMSSNFTIDGLTMELATIPKNVLIGWLGHELGHIMDYKNRSSFNLVIFGLKYLTSATYIRQAEITADTYAVRNGLRAYILATKEFILCHSELSEKYKERIRRLYMSPDKILEIVQEEGE